ncbi:uncharacterized protein I206_104894 [Kwoniella pini CBS 10737]|uniref:WHIM1 domain-containing protein n=1 Tax=Kwoniella pini CBS 10737 TaxID=1296096 RepID=A0A1B9I899_9TREE|nr:uncharacterized protein I206_02434 [Kwoniella pini CBS 10737]OCF51719.1 hypothetical protein I206_02434 [Kwoniella pini CBS 10737]
MSKIILKAGSSSSSTPNPIMLDGSSDNAFSNGDGYTSQDENEYVPLNREEQRIRDSKARYDEDVRKHQAIIEPKADRMLDDWQVAYVWSFIIKFNLRNQIQKLESIEDFERCLIEPVANRPDDILESILICFLANLKNLRSGSKSITPENVQSQLSNYIDIKLSQTSEWTVWDRGWPINEEDRGSCCTSDPFRSELGRLRYYGEPSNARAAKNPIRQVEERGGGIFELDWTEKVAILRQMVDWQLTHSESIRDKINKEFPANARDSKAKKAPPPELNDKDTITIKELGLTRDRARVWSFDDSWRLYKSGNPYKRPCQLTSITTNRESYHDLIEDMGIFSQSVDTVNNVTKGSKQASEQRKVIQARKNEGALVEKLKERIESIEKEEARIQRVRKRIAQAVEMQQRAELRSTRTRRQSRKVDYVYDNVEDIDLDGEPSRKRNQRSPEFNGLDAKGRPIIPGERRSARQEAKYQEELINIESNDFDQEDKSVIEGEHGDENGYGNGTEESIEMERTKSDSKSITGSTSDMEMNGNWIGLTPEDIEREKKKRKRMKGYAWVDT